MGLFIGNVTKQTPTTLEGFNTSLTESPIYGAVWDGNSHTGRRLYDAIGMKWTVSNSEVAGIDEFQDAENGKSPFHVWKGVDVWDAENKVHNVTVDAEEFDGENLTADNVVYTADPEKYKSMIVKNGAGATGNRICIYKKFYWKRPSEWCWMVSSSPHKDEGFSIHPAFYRRKDYDSEKIEWKYMNVGEFCMNSSDYRSQPGYRPAGSDMNTFRAQADKMGCMVYDWPIASMINILATIKYCSLNSQITTGYGRADGSNSFAEDSADNILGLDGYNGNNINAGTDVRTMGLVNWYGNTYEFVEGLFSYGYTIYYNSDGTCHIWPSTSNYASYGYKALPISIQSAGLPSSNGRTFNKFVYDNTNPEMMYPISPGGNDTDPIGDYGWHDTGQDCVIRGCSAAAGPQCGLFTWNSAAALSVSDWTVGSRLLFWS